MQELLLKRMQENLSLPDKIKRLNRKLREE